MLSELYSTALGKVQKEEKKKKQLKGSAFFNILDHAKTIWKITTLPSPLTPTLQHPIAPT